MMALGARAKRLTYLVHRWTGVVGCILMLLWFISGVVMLYVGYPKLTPWERLGAMPALSASAACCVAMDGSQAVPLEADAELVLTQIGGAPRYVVHGSQGWRVIDARDGMPSGAVGPDEALAEARAFSGQTDLTYAGTVVEDRWTHSRGLNSHRPLHRVEVGGDAPGTLYISSATGQVMLDAPLWQQRWNYVGAWLHWLYMFRFDATDPVWSWTVIILSALGTFSAVTGVFVGIWRWRFRGRYKSGSHSPYREPWMKWHHIVGLVFSAFVCTWIFSGLMSMNPFGVLSPRGDGPDLAAYYGEPGVPSRALVDPRSVLSALDGTGFKAVELQWQTLGGETYVLAYDASAHSRIVRQQGGALQVSEHWPAEHALALARGLFTAPLAHQAVLNAYDAYYYQRHPEAMNGASIQGLPALRLDFAAPADTRVYIDLQTGFVAQSLDPTQRVGRWLFYFLHSWDVPRLLDLGAWRDVVLILLSLGGTVICATGVVIGWRRLRHTVAGKARAGGR